MTTKELDVLAIRAIYWSTRVLMITLPIIVLFYLIGWFSN